MLETKDEPDIVNMGEQLLEDLDKYKDLSQSKVFDNIGQLALVFDAAIIGQLKSVVEC